MDLFSLIAGFFAGFIGGAIYCRNEAEKKEEKEQAVKWEQYFEYRKLLAESQKIAEAEAEASLDWAGHPRSSAGHPGRTWGHDTVGEFVGRADVLVPN